MIPSSPHRVTIGTGERRMSATVLLRFAGQLSIGPKGVADQSKRMMIWAASPPPVKNGKRAGVGMFKLALRPLVVGPNPLATKRGETTRTCSLIVNGRF